MRGMFSAFRPITKTWSTNDTIMAINGHSANFRLAGVSFVNVTVRSAIGNDHLHDNVMTVHDSNLSLILDDYLIVRPYGPASQCDYLRRIGPSYSSDGIEAAIVAIVARCFRIGIIDEQSSFRAEIDDPCGSVPITHWLTYWVDQNAANVGIYRLATAICRIVQKVVNPDALRWVAISDFERLANDASILPLEPNGLTQNWSIFLGRNGTSNLASHAQNLRRLSTQAGTTG